VGLSNGHLLHRAIVPYRLQLCSRVNMLTNPKKIARKRFMVFFSSVWPREQHIKSWPKLDHQKGCKYDVKKDGRH